MSLAAESRANAAKTHCLRGHLLSGENLYVPPRTNSRNCRTCRAQRLKQWQAKAVDLSSPSAAERFWEKVQRRSSDECWPWRGHLESRGYGRFFLNGRMTGAHRVAYQFVRGPIPPRLMVCHRCDNPACCNPDHLWLGTARENTRDMIAKGRRWRPGVLIAALKKFADALSERAPPTVDVDERYLAGWADALLHAQSGLRFILSAGCDQSPDASGGEK